jgi:glutaredoxin
MNKILYALLILLPFTVCAEIYKTVDENGRIIFTDKPTAKAEQVEVDTSVNNADGLSGSAYSKANDIKSKKPVKQKTVMMYSTSWCGVCTNARNYMRSNNIRFTELDIEKNNTAQAEYKKLGGKGVPLILVGSQKMSGFSSSRLESMLKPDK